MKNKKKSFAEKFQTLAKHPAAIVAIVVFFMAAFFFLSGDVHAQRSLREVTEEGLNYGTLSGLGKRDFREVIFLIINVLLGFASLVAVLIIMYAGFLWMTSQGDPNQIERAKRMLTNAVIGLILIFTSYSIAAFIIRMLVGGVGPGRRVPPPPPPLGGCQNCSALGSGIIESVYPPPAARDMPRDTAIIVTFKEVMDTSTIIAGAAAGCPVGGATGDHLFGADNIKITWPDPATGLELFYAGADVSASTSDCRTFVFRPVKYMGDGVNNIVYTVRLGKEIKKNIDLFNNTNGKPGSDGKNDTAFPGVRNFFSWWFEVGTRLDLDPPQVKVNGVVPRPETAAGIDNYAATAGAQATGSLKLKGVPKIYTAALVEDTPAVKVSGTAVGTVQGTYRGDKDAKICMTGTGAALNIFAVKHDDNCNAAKETLSCLNNSSPLVAGVVVGCGLSVEFDTVPGNTDQYSIRVKKEVLADTLRVSNKTYSFVSVNPGQNDISVGADADATARIITDKVNAVLETPDVTAQIGGDPKQINFTSALYGEAGNRIQIEASGSWIEAPISFFLSKGIDVSTERKILGVPDESRDIILKINFTEAMLPPTVGGVIEVNAGGPTNGVGTLKAGVFRMIEVFADWNNDAVPDSNEHVAGTWRVSNQYQTAEFYSSLSCGVCRDGITACSGDNECPLVGGVVDAGSCSIVKNSCGDVKKCLPVPQNADAINYIVRLNTPNLKTCTDVANDTDCADPDYNDCVNIGAGYNVCQNGAGTRYPKAGNELSLTVGGAVDMSSNGLDGTRGNSPRGRKKFAATVAERNSPENFFQDIPGAAGFPDYTKYNGYEWRFNINKTININPPKILDVTPNQDTVTSLLTRPQAKFDKIMLSDSLKPDNSYKDGSCGCDPTKTDDKDNDTVIEPGEYLECFEGEYCDNAFTLCRRADNSDNFCRYDNECKNTGRGMCRSQDYVTLIDTLQNVGYSIGAQDIDESLVDGYPDRTVAEVGHTLFTENQSYHVDVGSGVKDIYQNCFLPGTGEACTATAQNPYCCYGTAQKTPCSPSTRQ